MGDGGGHIEKKRRGRMLAHEGELPVCDQIGRIPGTGKPGERGIARRWFSGEPAGPGFSRAMALRRLHWKNSLLGEALYLVNVAKTGRVHLLPPQKRPPQRPTFFFVF